MWLLENEDLLYYYGGVPLRRERRYVARLVCNRHYLAVLATLGNGGSGTCPSLGRRSEQNIEHIAECSRWRDSYATLHTTSTPTPFDEVLLILSPFSTHAHFDVYDTALESRSTASRCAPADGHVPRIHGGGGYTGQRNNNTTPLDPGTRCSLS